MSKARHWTIGNINLLVFGFGWWGYYMAIGTHRFAVELAFEEAGDGAGWLTLLLPFLSEIYWLFREAWKVGTWDNPFTWAVAWTLIVFAGAYAFAWLSLRLSRGYVPHNNHYIVRDMLRREAMEEKARL